MSPSTIIVKRPAYSKLLLAFVLLAPLGAVAQNTDPGTSVDAEPPTSSAAPPPEEISVTYISTDGPVALPSAAPPAEEGGTLTGDEPTVTPAPYPGTPEQGDPIYPGGQGEPTPTPSHPNYAPNDAPESVKNLYDTDTAPSQDSGSYSIALPSATVGGQISDTTVGRPNPTPGKVPPQGTPEQGKNTASPVNPGAKPPPTGASQAQQEQNTGASQTAAVPASGGNTQGPSAGTNVPAASGQSNPAGPSGGNAASGTAAGGAAATGTGAAGSGAAPTDGAATTADDDVSPSATSSGAAQFTGSANRNAIERGYATLLGIVGFWFALL